MHVGQAVQEPSPQVAEEVYEHALEVPVAITQRELLVISPEVKTQVADVTRSRRQQEAQFMMYDIANTALTAAVDSSITLSTDDLGAPLVW
jgi:hypothetical protein